MNIVCCFIYFKYIFVEFSLLHIVILLVVYFFSGIPTGAIIAHYKKFDIRKFGSGNIGTTNIYRAFGLKWAVFTFVIDSLRGIIPLLVLYILNFSSIFLCIASGVSLFASIFSPYLKFKGGKGVSVYIGVIIFFIPYYFLVIIIVWGVMFLFFRVVSLVNLIIVCIIPLLFYNVYGQPGLLLGLFSTILIWYSHRSNVKRIISNNELTFRNK